MIREPSTEAPQYRHEVAGWRNLDAARGDIDAPPGGT